MSWDRVRGHESLVKLFAEASARGRLGHAYLFAGPRGIGKRLFAAELTKALLCEQPPKPFDSCDKCPACTQVEAGTHPDVLHAALPDDKHEFPIEVMRDLVDRIQLSSARGGYKFAIIDDADDFNDESANCFLKTLEEPPPKSIVILLSTDPNLQKSTIVSRCQVIRFSALPRTLVKSLLMERGVEFAKAERLARLAGGSIGQALELADESLWAFRADLLADLARPKIDALSLTKKWTALSENLGKEKSSQQRSQASLVVKMLIDVFDEALRASVGAGGEVDLDERAIAETLAQRWGTEKLMQLIDRCLRADHHIERRVQLLLAQEALADALAAT